jgi:hypothetical protein
LSNSEIIKAVLDECFPGECDVAGSSNLEEILGGTTEVVRARYGSNMDLTQALTVLVAAVTFTDSAIAIYEFLARRPPSAPPSAAELEEAVARDARIPTGLDEESRCRICEALLPLLRERMGRGDHPGSASESRDDAHTGAGGGPQGGEKQ